MYMCVCVCLRYECVYVCVINGHVDMKSYNNDLKTERRLIAFDH